MHALTFRQKCTKNTQTVIHFSRYSRSNRMTNKWNIASIEITFCRSGFVFHFCVFVYTFLLSFFPLNNSLEFLSLFFFSCKFQHKMRSNNCSHNLFVFQRQKTNIIIHAPTHSLTCPNQTKTKLQFSIYFSLFSVGSWFFTHILSLIFHNSKICRAKSHFSISLWTNNFHGWQTGNYPQFIYSVFFFMRLLLFWNFVCLYSCRDFNCCMCAMILHTMPLGTEFTFLFFFSKYWKILFVKWESGLVHFQISCHFLSIVSFINENILYNLIIHPLNQ